MKKGLFWDMCCSDSHGAASSSEVPPPLTVVSGWDSSALSATCCVNKVDSSHWFSSQQDALRNSADVKTLLPSSELVVGRKLVFVICILIQLCSERREWLSNYERRLKRLAIIIPGVFLAVLPMKNILNRNMLSWFVDSVRAALHISLSLFVIPLHQWE